MDRFSILLKKPRRKPIMEDVPNAPKIEDVPNHTIRVEIPSRTDPNRRVSAAYSDYDQRPESVNFQTLHPNDGDLIIFSVPRACADDLDMFQDIMEAKIRELGVRCEVIVCNY
jgi:hypothetical protein